MEWLWALALFGVFPRERVAFSCEVFNSSDYDAQVSKQDQCHVLVLLLTLLLLLFFLYLLLYLFLKVILMIITVRATPSQLR